MKTTFGTNDYGGLFIPESLISVLKEVEEHFFKLVKDQGFLSEIRLLNKEFGGRETPLTFLPNLSNRFGCQIYLKREDLLHGGAHKINSTIGQLVMAKRMGKQRIISETGAGQHGVATAMTGARLGLDVDVYMGEVDIERQHSNVKRMELYGANVIPVSNGRATLKDAINEAIRDWITNVDNTYHCFGTAAGPFPYPELVRYFQEVIGVESRKQILANGGELPTAVFACIGGGSNALGLFLPFVDDKSVQLFGVEPAGMGVETGRHAATLTMGKPGVFHGMHSLWLQNDEGQITNTHSIAAGLDYPGVGPELVHLQEAGRAKIITINDDEALDAFEMLSKYEGIIPAFESAHALAGAFQTAETLSSNQKIIICLSGRGDKDLDTYCKIRGL